MADNKPEQQQEEEIQPVYSGYGAGTFKDGDEEDQDEE